MLMLLLPAVALLAASPAPPAASCYCSTNPFAPAQNCKPSCCVAGAHSGNVGGACPALPDPDLWTEMTTVEVPAAKAAGAVYPDGSPAKFELNFTGSPGWVVHLSGGGWRFMKPGQSQLLGQPPARLTPDGATAAPSDSGCYGHCDGIMSTEPTQNRLFSSWNKVFVPISGTSFTGDRSSDKPYPVRGARILKAVIEYLQSHYGMAAASDVILTGGSSGGLATYLVCDRVAGMVSGANATTKYSCLADAGFFLDHGNVAGAPTTSPQFKESFVAWNSSGGTNQDCIKHYTPLGTPELCIFAEYVAPFIKSPLFIAQNLYDSWQLNNILKVTTGGCGGYGHNLSTCTGPQMGAVQAYGATMRTRLNISAFPKRGIFAPSCIAHCQTTENEHPASLWQWPARWGIGHGVSPPNTPQEVHANWYNVVMKGEAGPSAFQLEEQGPWGSNPRCPLYT